MTRAYGNASCFNEAGPRPLKMCDPLSQKDSLAPTAALLRAVLGPEKPLSAMLAEAAEANTAPATRAARQERERIRQARFWP